MKRLLYFFDLLIYYPIFKFSLIACSIPARLKFIWLLGVLMRFNAKFTLFMRCGKRKDSIEEVGKEWKRMFPLEIQQLIKTDEDTVYYETHCWCPLRGSGDVLACYRMMEYDRCMCETLGGQFVVIKSQAEPGNKTCMVAIRKPGKSTDDLIHAHERYKE